MGVRAFFNTIILLASLQGFIISILLFLSVKNRRPNRILAVLIFLSALASFNLYGYSQSWFHSPFLNFLANLLPLIIVMPFGPLVWFYVQSSLNPGFRIAKMQRRHFYPVIIDLVPSLTVIIYLTATFFKQVKNDPVPWGNFIDTYNVYSDIPRWLSVTIYVLASAKYVRAYRTANATALNGNVANVKWLQQFIKVFLVFQVIWLLYLIPYVIPKYTDMMLDTFSWYPIYIPLAVLIYWLGIKGYIVSVQQSAADKKAKSSNLSAGMIQLVTAALTKAMEVDKLYLDATLNLAALSNATGVAQKNISAVLNQHLHKSLNEFVNGYRIAAVKEKMLLPEMNNLTIAGIAMECGFNSQATFQRTFKEFTGESPTAFIKTAATAR